MALSRFWSYIIVLSALYIFYMLGTGQMYSLGSMVNGKQNDPTVIAEIEAKQLALTDTALFAALKANKTVASQSGDSTYQLQDNGIVQLTTGKLAADGIFPTCNNTIMDIWLPLIGCITFFCGLLNLLNDSNAITKLANILSPFFVRVFPELPKGH